VRPLKPPPAWASWVLVLDPPEALDPAAIWRFIRALEASEYREHPAVKQALRDARRDLRYVLQDWGSSSPPN
jgi:hypothetical protein